MFGLFCLFIVLCYVVGYGHLAFVNFLTWFLDEQDNVEVVWSGDLAMKTLLLPGAFVLVACELFFLYGRA